MLQLDIQKPIFEYLKPTKSRSFGAHHFITQIFSRMNPFKSLALIATSALFIVSCQKEETFSKQSLTLDLDNAANNPVLSGQPEFVPNELLVKFKSGTSVAARGKALGLLGASVQEHIHTAAMRSANDMEGVFLLKVNANAMDAIVKAKGLGEVEYAEPNWIYTHDAVSNDPGFGNLWGMQTSWGHKLLQHGTIIIPEVIRYT